MMTLSLYTSILGTPDTLCWILPTSEEFESRHRLLCYTTFDGHHWQVCFPNHRCINFVVFVLCALPFILVSSSSSSVLLHSTCTLVIASPTNDTILQSDTWFQTRYYFADNAHLMQMCHLPSAGSLMAHPLLDHWLNWRCLWSPCQGSHCRSEYLWGVAEVENENYFDFCKLYSLLRLYAHVRPYLNGDGVALRELQAATDGDEKVWGAQLEGHWAWYTLGEKSMSDACTI